MEKKAPIPQTVMPKSDRRSSVPLDAPKRIKLNRSWNPLVLDREVEKLEKTPMKGSVESSTGKKLSRKRNAEECLLKDEAKKPINSLIFEFEPCAFKSPLLASEVPLMEESHACKIAALAPEIPFLEEPCLCKSPLLAPQIPIVGERHVPSPTQLKSSLEAPGQEAFTPNSSSVSEITLSVIAVEVDSLEKTNMKVYEELNAGEKPARKKKAEESPTTDVAKTSIDSPFLKLEPHACKSTLLDTEVPFMEEPLACKIAVRAPEITVPEEPCLCKSPLLAPQIPIVGERHVPSPTQLKSSLEAPGQEAFTPNSSSVSEIKLSVIAEEVESLEKTSMKVSEELNAGEKPTRKRKAEESLTTDVAKTSIDSPFLKLEPHACKSTLVDTEVPVLEESYALSPKRLKTSLETPVPEACIPNISAISSELCEISSTSPGESSVSIEDSLEKLMEFWMQYYEEGMDLEYGKTIEQLLQEI